MSDAKAVSNALAVLRQCARHSTCKGCRDFETCLGAGNALSTLAAEFADREAQESLAFSAGAEEGRAWAANELAELRDKLAYAEQGLAEWRDMANARDEVVKAGDALVAVIAMMGWAVPQALVDKVTAYAEARGGL